MNKWPWISLRDHSKSSTLVPIESAYTYSCYFFFLQEFKMPSHHWQHWRPRDARASVFCGLDELSCVHFILATCTQSVHCPDISFFAVLSLFFIPSTFLSPLVSQSHSFLLLTKDTKLPWTNSSKTTWWVVFINVAAAIAACTSTSKLLFFALFRCHLFHHLWSDCPDTKKNLLICRISCTVNENPEHYLELLSL